jgi:VIT1/CCC1 family predicted Fe2+/Mn2+ transporter
LKKPVYLDRRRRKVSDKIRWVWAIVVSFIALGMLGALVAAIREHSKEKIIGSSIALLLALIAVLCCLLLKRD